MNCPLCITESLINEDLLQNLQAKKCNKCGGRWLPSYQYWKWIEKQGATFQEKPQFNVLPLDMVDSPSGKLCPECGHFLSQKKVGHGLRFHLDRCMHCGGFWFDDNEWDVLLSKNLHDEVHLVFSEAWQRHVKKEDSDLIKENRLEKILGKEDHLKLIEITDWINTHPQKSTILSYLINVKV